MIFGHDALGGKHFQKPMLQAQRSGDCGGIFHTTFGDATGTIRAWMQSKKWSELVDHLAPFDRSHAYEFDKYLPQVYKLAAICEQIQKENPHTKLMISPFCEHNHPTAKMIPVFKKLKQIAPSCLLVNSIWKGGVVPGVITELHLENSKSRPKIPQGEYIISLDGFGGKGEGDSPDADLIPIIQYYSGARQFRVWNFRYNGKFGHKDETAVSDRKHWPDVKYLKGHRALLDGREGPVTWPNSALYKPFADDHGQGGKDNKAMCIIKGAKAAIVKDSKGNKIVTMRRVLPDHADGPRFYAFDHYAYELGDIAQKNTGSRRISINNLPLTDADLRSGKFK